MPKVEKVPVFSISFEVNDEVGNVIYRVKKQPAKNSKHRIMEILRFKL